jgi:hypothetical protein
MTDWTQVAQPGGMTLVEVAGQFLKSDGSPQTEGKVIFRPLLPPERNNVCLTVDPVIAYLDGEGRFSVRVVPSDDPVWNPYGESSTPYLVDIRIGASRVQHRVFILARAQTQPGFPLELPDLIENWSVASQPL